jgi:hypothetical protein
MRTWAVVAPFVFAVAAGGYVVLSLESVPTDNETTIPVVDSSANNLRTSLLDVLEELRLYRVDGQSQFETAMDGQAKLGEELRRISERLELLEQSSEQGAVHAASSANELPLASLEDADTSAVSQALDARVTESDLGAWMSRSLDVGYQDDQETSLAAEQAHLTVAKKLANTSLDDIQCETRFCRAVFSAFDGSVPEIREVFGEPPFMTQGFTLNEPDGRVVLYFTRPGVSIADLEREVKGY